MKLKGEFSSTFSQIVNFVESLSRYFPSDSLDTFFSCGGCLVDEHCWRETCTVHLHFSPLCLQFQLDCAKKKKKIRRRHPKRERGQKEKHIVLRFKLKRIGFVGAIS